MSMQGQPQCVCCETPSTGIDYDCQGVCDVGTTGSIMRVVFPAFNATPTDGTCCDSIPTPTEWEVPFSGVIDPDPMVGYCQWRDTFPHPCLAEGTLTIQVDLFPLAGAVYLQASIVETLGVDTAGHSWLVSLGAPTLDCITDINGVSVPYNTPSVTTFNSCMDGWDFFGPPGDALVTAIL